MVLKRIVPVCLCALLGVLLANAGELIDRIVATVNGHIILQSDRDDAVRYEALTSGRLPEQLSAVDRKSALDRLIDQELLREQMNASDTHATSEDVARRIEEIRKQYPTAVDDRTWHALLMRYGINEDELQKRVSLQLDLLRLVDARLRPTVQIDAQSIESYYNQELLPQLRQMGRKAAPLEEVTPKIKELLTQKKMNQLLAAWLQNLRAGSNIRTEVSSSPTGGDETR